MSVEKKPDRQVPGPGSDQRGLDSRIDQLEEYALLNARWAAELAAWGTKIAHEIYGSQPETTSEEPPKPPTWPPPKWQSETDDDN